MTPKPVAFHSRKRGIKAPFIFKNFDYFYLFASYEYCCHGAKSNYKMHVGRSKTLTGRIDVTSLTGFWYRGDDFFATYITSLRDLRHLKMPSGM